MAYLKSKPGSVEEAITAAVFQEKLKPAKKPMPPMFDKKGNLNKPYSDKPKKEDLSPKQKKIDANKNGKIDASDLAKLRAKKEDNNTDTILPKSQSPKSDNLDIKTKEPVKKITDNKSKSDKIDVNPKIDYQA